MSGREELNAKLLELIDDIHDKAVKGAKRYYLHHEDALKEIADMIQTFWDSEESCGS